MSVLVLIVTAQIVLIHYYGHSGGNGSDVSYIGAHGAGSLFLRNSDGPPLRINLRALLPRNVPSIAANLRQIRLEINTQQINRFIAQQALVSPELEIHFSNASAVEMSANSSQLALPDCPLVPKGLIGAVFADTNHSHAGRYSERSVAAANMWIRDGGQWHPSECLSRYRVAVIIPYRDRRQHLNMLLAHLHPILRRQQLNYKIYVVEQYGNGTFNKARIMNVAFLTALEQQPYLDCVVFHDVDLIPEDDRNMYSCPQWPRHMSVAIDEMNYQIPYEQLVGGVLAIRVEHFFKVNGYSNLYWGWGAEDDDIALRIEHVGLRIIRPPAQIGRYKMIKHVKRPAVDSRIRYRLLWTGVRRYKIDGLNSMRSLGYKMVSIRPKPLYTHLLVDIGDPPPGF